MSKKVIYLPYGAVLPNSSSYDVVVGGNYSLPFLADLSNNSATNVLIDGYTLHLDLGTDTVKDGFSSSVAPQLKIEGVVFGPHLTIDVGDLDSQSGSIYATGYNQIAGTLNANANLDISILDQTDAHGAVIVPGTLNNTGTITSPFIIGGGVDAKLINAGTINIAPAGPSGTGTFIDVNIMGTGTINLSGDLQLSDKIATGQTINFTAGSLVLLDLKGFDATIANFNSHDAINLNGNLSNPPTSAVYNNGLLTLYDAGQHGVGVLHFKRPAGAGFTSDSFHLNNGVLTTMNTIFHAT